jgi:hypothetical protein
MGLHAARTGSGLLAEVMFVVMPLMAIFLIGLKHIQPPINVPPSHPSIVASPEWSVGAIILFGQVIVKFTMSVAKQSRVAAGPLALVLVMLLVLGLLPSLFLLIYATDAREGYGKADDFLNIAQVTMFTIAAIVYILLGMICELVITPSPSVNSVPGDKEASEPGVNSLANHPRIVAHKQVPLESSQRVGGPP